MKTSVPRFVLALVSWVYVFGICTLMLFGMVPADGVAVGSFLLFALIAGIASSNPSRIRKGNNVEVNIAGNKYAGDSVRLIDGANGITYIFVDLTKPANELQQPKATNIMGGDKMGKK